MDFELRMYQLDADINTILKDLETSQDPKLIKNHFERVQSLVETYRELMLSGIHLDISYDPMHMEKLASKIFDKYCELI